MQAEQQYIEFFTAQKQALNKISSELVNSRRNKAFEMFQKNGFPVFNSENYQHTDIPTFMSPDYGFNFSGLKAEIDPYKVFKCNVPNLSSNVHFIVNDRLYKSEEREPMLPGNVFSGSLNDFAKSFPEIFEKYYGKLATPDRTGIESFNTMFVQDGYVLYIPENVILEKPVQVTNIIRGNVDSLITRRFLIIVEEGAQAKVLVCDHTADETPKFLINQVTEIFIGEKAVFDFYELEESSDNTIRLTSCIVSQKASSNVMVNNITLCNGFTRNDYNIFLEGENAETHLYGLAISDKTRKIDNNTNIEHRVPHCRSNELFKYILDDQAIGSFSGRIIVAKDAQKTQAYQDNRNLCGSRECRMFSKPQLEIDADDVKCSHGMTIGQLDEAALFYMRSRGIKEEEARLLLKFAFTNDVIEGIRLQTLRERLKMLVEKRFRGELVKCRGCI
ncbi:MAG: Fe-S cluster assembly protein SufD [Dysgonamonadaceae bacterium]|jgi:Fe-S cluster assembly protein SufD|nr:Fe-S cluster assembly protein SufD [Dysgonamonadaceae bacterium]